MSVYLNHAMNKMTEVNVLPVPHSLRINEIQRTFQVAAQNKVNVDICKE